MIFRNAFRSFAYLVPCVKSSNHAFQFHAMTVRYCTTKLPQPNKKINYVQQMKMLMNVKEKNGLDESSISKGRCLIYFKGDPLLDDNYSIAWVDNAHLGLDQKVFIDNSVLLGVNEEGRLQFSLQIANLGKDVKKIVVDRTKGNFTDFRLSLMMMPAGDAALVSKAKAIYTWHKKNGHCANCGTKSDRHSTGSSRSCSKCGEVWYPTLSPVGIVLVADKSKKKLLLVRQGRHPKGMYSCIAGFVDLGIVHLI